MPFLPNADQLINLKLLHLQLAISYPAGGAGVPTGGSLSNPHRGLQMSFVVGWKLRCPEV